MLRTPRSLRKALTVLFSTAVFSAILYAQQPLSNINNITQTPKPGTPHDYLKDLNEIINPANGSVTIKIAAPTPSERDAVRVPQYAYIYSSNAKFSPSADFVEITVSGQPTGQMEESAVYFETLNPSVITQKRPLVIT